MDALFDSQRFRLPEEAAANASKAAQVAEESTKAAQQAEDLRKREDEEQKRKREQATEAEELAAKRQIGAERFGLRDQHTVFASREGRVDH